MLSGTPRPPSRLRETDPGVLIIAGSHGFPRAQARLSRAAELAAQIAGRGAPVDQVLLIEKPLHPYEEEALDVLRRGSRSLDVVLHPASESGLKGACLRLLHRREGERLGGAWSCPRSLIRLIRTRYAARRYRAVIACGVHLAPCLSFFKDSTEKLVDLQRIGHEAHLAHERMGLGRELAIFRSEEEERELLGLAGVVMVSSTTDAVLLREKGFGGDLIRVPPLGGLEKLPQAPTGGPGGPVRPPRILCAGSAAAANVDGVRWFRREILPRILDLVPEARLRLVGDVARPIEPGPGVDRVGWVDDIHEEYGRAAVIALPLRAGSGLHRRAVEALSHGRALATTAVGARGVAIASGYNAVVSDDPRVLGGEIARILASDADRLAMEGHALRLAAEWFDPMSAHAQLAERLGLEERLPDPAPEAVPALEEAVTVR